MNGIISTYKFLYNLYSTIHEYKISVQILMTKLLLKRFVLTFGIRNFEFFLKLSEVLCFAGSN